MLSDTSCANGNEEEFSFLTFDKDFIHRHGLPDQLYPIRLSVLHNILSRDKSAPGAVRPDAVPLLANEGLLYVERHPDARKEMSGFLARLCYVAGISVGSSGNHLMALHFFQTAYALAPDDFNIARNYGLSLWKLKRLDEAAEIYEIILSKWEGGGKGFSPDIWTEAINIHYMTGNYRRALQLVEIALRITPDLFQGAAQKAFVQDIRQKVSDG